RDEGLRVDVEQRGNVVRFDVERCETRSCAQRRAARSRCGDLLPAHRHRTMKKPFRGGHRHQRCDLCAAARLAEHGDTVGIAAEFRRVISHPLERLNEIENSDIARYRILGSRNAIEIEMAEYVEPVIDRDHDDVAALAKPRAVIERARSRTAAELTAM